MPKNDGIASGESMGRKLGGWDEAAVGAVGDDAPVGVHKSVKGARISEGLS